MFSRRRAHPGDNVPSRAEELTVSEALLETQPSAIFLRWANEGRLGIVLPDLAALRGIGQAPAHRDDAFVHTLKVVDAIEPTPVRRWAALLHDIAKALTYIETPDGRSRFFEHDRIGAEMAGEILAWHVDDRSLIQNATRLVRLHMRPISYLPEWTDAAVRRLCDEAEQGRGPQGWEDLMALARADLRGYLPEPIDRGLWVLEQLERRRRNLEGVPGAGHALVDEPRSPLNGDEILALGEQEPGPWVGELKDYLRGEVEAGRLGRHDRDGARMLALRWLSVAGGGSQSSEP